MAGKRDFMTTARLSEKHVCQQLIHQDWLILARNYRKRGVEIDIIAQKASTVIAVEVKARRTHPHLESLFAPKQVARIQAELLRFLGMRQLGYQTLRVDGALVLFRHPWRVVELRYFVNIGRVSPSRLG